MSPKRPSVVIADNNQFYLQAVGDLYRDLGFEVRIAQDGIEALERIGESVPDLLVLDLIMPRIDGAQLCALVKRRPELKRIRVIILSGILADEIEDVATIRADAYVAKMPLDQIADALTNVTRDLLDGKPGGSPRVRGFEKMYRREVVRELLQERRTRHDILDSLSEGILELSDDGRILAVNTAFETLCGRTEGELLSRRLEEIFPAGAATLASLFSEVGSELPVSSGTIQHEQRELQVKLHRLNPDTGPESDEVRRAMIRAAGESKNQLPAERSEPGYTLLIEDVTEKARTERERERLRLRLSQSEKMSAIGLLVSGLAHELNNPLTSVLGYAQLLKSRPQAGGLGDELDKIANGALRCKTIVEELLVFARSVRPEKALHDVNEILLESTSAFRERLGDVRADLDLDLASDLPPLLADRAQMSAAFEHVLDNAVKALAGWDGKRRVTVSSSLRGGRVHIEFKDTGPGIPPEVLGKVFEPFFTTRQLGQGAGLGLSAAYGIVTAHAGRVMAANDPRGGATIRIDLPCAPSVSAEKRGRDKAATEPRGRRILIVDDEPVVVELLADLFEQADHQIDTASSGREGLGKMRAHDYDLVILDLRMPDMPGQQVYEEVAKDRPHLARKVLFITADTLTPEVRGFLDGSTRPWLQKPFSIDKILDGARRILTS